MLSLSSGTQGPLYLGLLRKLPINGYKSKPKFYLNLLPLDFVYPAYPIAMPLTSMNKTDGLQLAPTQTIGIAEKF